MMLYTVPDSNAIRFTTRSCYTWDLALAVMIYALTDSVLGAVYKWHHHLGRLGPNCDTLMTDDRVGATIGFNVTLCKYGCVFIQCLLWRWVPHSTRILVPISFLENFPAQKLSYSISMEISEIQKINHWNVFGEITTKCHMPMFQSLVWGVGHEVLERA